MSDASLNPSIRPGEENAGGRHLGSAPVWIGLGFGALIVAGVMYAVTSRMQSSEETASAPEIPKSQSEPAENMVEGALLSAIETDEVNAAVETQASEQAATTLSLTTPAVPSVPAVSEALSERKKFLQEQRKQAWQDEALAQQSSTVIVVGDLTSSANKQPAQPSVPPLLQSTNEPRLPSELLNRLAGQGAVPPDSQTKKQNFLADEDQSAAWLKHTRQVDISPFTLKTGTVIPGILISGLSSDLPGTVVAQVAENVRDSATGRYILIPQGAKLYGAYDSNVDYGQNRALVAWERIIFPDASTLELGRMAGADRSGYAGFKDKVNNHYVKLFLQTFLMSAIQAVPAKLSDSTSGDDEFSKIAATNYAQASGKLVERNLAVQPTIRIRPGYQFIVMVNKDILFPGPYNG